MTDEEIQAAGRAAFHLGAGWGGVSFTNEGGIATINSQGVISWSSTGQPNSGRSHFASGKDALDALATALNSLLGKTDNAPPQAPPPDNPQGPAPGEVD